MPELAIVTSRSDSTSVSVLDDELTAVPEDALLPGRDDLGKDGVTDIPGGDTVGVPTESDPNGETALRFQSHLEKPREPAALIPRLMLPEDAFEALQKWEGTVLEVGKKSFTARLVDIRNDDEPDEEGEILLEEVSPADMALVAPGAVFYWTIGYMTAGSGQKRRVSQIRFRRLPVWTERDIEATRRRASDFRELLGS